MVNHYGAQGVTGVLLSAHVVNRTWADLRLSIVVYIRDSRTIYFAFPVITTAFVLTMFTADVCA